MSSLDPSVNNATTEDLEEKSIRFAATPDSDSETFVVDRKAEKALVRRLDLIFLSVAGLGYIFKYLDQTNIVRPMPDARSRLTRRAMPTSPA